MSKYTKFYAEYMRSAKWKRKQEACLKRDNYICQACLSEPATQAHHKTYVHFGNEPLFDLVSVSIKCHRQLTAMAHRRIKSITLEQQIESLLIPFES